MDKLEAEELAKEIMRLEMLKITEMQATTQEKIDALKVMK